MKLPKSWVMNLLFIVIILLIFGWGVVESRGQKDTVTALPVGFTPSSSDMSRDDAIVIALCQKQALQVTYDLVIQDPSLFTEEVVINISSYLYDNCIRDNGRGA